MSGAAERSAVGQSVLVVEDDPGIADILQITLRFHGFAVRAAPTAGRALELARSHAPDLVLLDVMLPDGSGWQVCRELRAGGDEPAVIFLSARDAPADVLGGLALGGDDYITKPFNVDEVVARVRAVLRRTRGRAPAGGVLRHGDVELDEATFTVRRGGAPVELTPTEYNLLRHLMRNAGRILTKEQLLRSVWQFDTAVESTVVETYISYLRRKLDPLGPPLIETRRGVGYGLRPVGPDGPDGSDGPDGPDEQAGPAGPAGAGDSAAPAGPPP